MLESLLIIIVNVCVYYRTIFNDLIMDDYQMYHYIKRCYENKSMPTILNDPRGWFERRFYGVGTFGLNIRLEHCFRVFLHTSICVLIYWALGHNRISLISSLLYSVNPINNQTSCWLNGKRYAISIILVLLMILFPIVSPAFYLLTCLLQVTAIFSPILLAGHSLWYLAIIPVFLLCGWARISKRLRERSRGITDGDLKTFKLTRLIVIVKTFGFFFWKMIFPQVCAMQYTDRIKWGLTKDGSKEAYEFNKDFYLGAIAISIVIGSIFIVPVQYKPFTIFILLSTLQWSAVLPVTQILSDRYCSMPNVFVMFFISLILSYTGVFYIPISVLLIAYYYVCLTVVFPMYKNLDSFYAYHFQHFPNLSWYRHNIIQDLVNSKHYNIAARHALEGFKHDPTDYRILMWCYLMCILNNNPKGASGFIDKAENNLYLNKEKEQLIEIAHAREQVAKLIPIIKKTDKMTDREKALFMKKIKLQNNILMN